MQIVRAIYDNTEAERARLVREQADRLAIANAKSRSETVEADTIYRAYEGVFVSVRQTILASALSDSEKADVLANLRHDITEADDSE
jgi:phage terminase Nu1 subunit (DNA packaging protein)